jgi:preprotein translocase subunit SecF
MEDLIFVLPIFIVFFIILFQIFSLFKKGFDFVRKKFNLTIDQAGEKTNGISSKINADYDQNEVKKRIAEAEMESLAERKKRILDQSAEAETKRQGLKHQRYGKPKKDNSKHEKRKNKNSSLGEIFIQYNELEKAVIYNEILSKPKALKND